MNYIPLRRKLDNNEVEDICIQENDRMNLNTKVLHAFEYTHVKMVYIRIWGQSVCISYDQNTLILCRAGYVDQNLYNGIGDPVIFTWCVVIMGLSEVMNCCNMVGTDLCGHWAVMDMMADASVYQMGLTDCV